MSGLFRRAVGLVTAAGVAGTIGALGAGTAAAQGVDGPIPVNEQAFDNFAACLQGANQEGSDSPTADILIVMDQSGSLAGNHTDESNDPDALRVDAALDFARSMADYADDYGASVRLAVSGFGETYYPADGGWTEVSRSGDGTNVDGTIGAFENRDDDLYTDYPQALDGAANEFGTDSADCRSVLFFSDGAPTVESGADTGAIMADVCRPDGPVARLRADGVQVFTVGLASTDAGETTEMRQTLPQISQGTECSGLGANGAHIDAGDAGALLSAFRRMVPQGASFIQNDVPMGETRSFVLDNSITEVKLGAVPDGGDTSAFAGASPMLISPDGQEHVLEPGPNQIGATEVVVEGNETFDGVFDLRMLNEGDWAGEWAFGYRLANPAGDASYRMSVDVSPGLRIAVNNSGENGFLSYSNQDTIEVSLLNREGQTQRFDGQANLFATVLGNDGAEIPLGPVPMDISEGTAQVPLDNVLGQVSGVLSLRVDITTADFGDVPGTPLTPLLFTKDVSVTPANQPSLPNAVDVTIAGTETTIDIPVGEPGSVWVEDGVLDMNGVQVAYSSPHNSPESALSAGGGTLPVTFTLEQPADTPILNQSIPVQWEGIDDAGVGETNVGLRGNVRSVVDAGTFGVAFVVLLLTALLIPLGVMYAMKALTGRIPKTPGINAMAIPVKTDGGRVLRTDRGGEFDVSFEEFAKAPRTVSNGKSIDLAGNRVAVKLGLSPFSPAVAVAQHPMSIADNAATSGTSARLPLGVHNHWFITMDPVRHDQITVVLAPAENVTREQLAKMVDAVRLDAAGLIEQLTRQAVEHPTGSGTGPSGTSGGRGKRSDRKAPKNASAAEPTGAQSDSTPPGPAQWGTPDTPGSGGQGFGSGAGSFGASDPGSGTSEGWGTGYGENRGREDGDGFGGFGSPDQGFGPR